MKKLFVLFAVAFLAHTAVHAQLENTKWKGTANIPAPTSLILSFGKDTVNAIAADDNSVIETMLYKIDKDVLTFVKVSGTSDCDNTAIGKYKFAIKDNKIMITLVDDPCEHRGQAFTSDGWIKQ